MSTTSANPDNLDNFVSKPVRPREVFEGCLTSAIATQEAVSGACVTHGVSGTYLTMGTTLVERMFSNEEFVRGVRDALLDADRLDGVASIDDGAVVARLAGGDYATEQPEYVMPEVAMIGAPANSGYVDDPICAANGNFILVETDLEFPALSSVLQIERWYNSLAAEKVGVFGAGWSCVLDMRLDFDDAVVSVRLHDGAVISFESSADGGWTTSDRRRHDLTGDERGFVLRRHDAEHWSWTFDQAGELIGWSVGGSSVVVDRTAEMITRLSSSGSGRVIDIGYHDDVVASLVSDDGRTVRYTSERQALQTVRSAGVAVDYAYERSSNGPLLLTAVDADGVTEFVNEFDDAGRVIRQTSAFGRVTSYRYEIPGSTVITDEAGVRQAMVHDARGNLTAVVDVDGSVMRITYDALDRATRIVDQVGNVTVNEFDGTSDRLARRTDPDGSGETWTWDRHGRVTVHTQRDGVCIRYAYDERPGSEQWCTPIGTWRNESPTLHNVLDDNGLVTSSIDADGVEVRHEYDRDGQTVRSTDALGHSMVWHHDERGSLIEWRDQIGVAVEIAHDDAGRLVAADLHDVSVTFGYTAAGRPASGTLAGGAPWSVERGGHGAVTSFCDPAGAVVTFGHDTQGHVISATAPDGATYQRSFSPVGLPLSLTDPSGATWRVEYDRAGREVSQIDATGAATRRTVDALGRTVAITSPDGASSQYRYHSGGQIESVTSADGRRWVAEIDDAGRAVAIIDPLGRRASRTYTPAGRLASRTSPAGRIEQFEYDRCGRLAAIVRDGRREVRTHDARGLLIAVDDDRFGSQRFEWDAHRRLVSHRRGEQEPTVFTRDGVGQITDVVDGTGAATRYRFDERGLLASTIDAAGLTTTFEHDVRGRLVRQTVPGDRTTVWTFGDAGFPSGWVDPAGVVTAIDRNANGRIVGIQRGGAALERHLDACGREVRRTASDGSELSSFIRDQAGRVLTAGAAADELAVDFLWDDDDRLVSSTMHGSTSSVTRDDDGIPTGFVIDDIEDVRHIRDPHGRIVGALGTTIRAVVQNSCEPLPRDAAGRLLAGTDGTIYRYDDAGRLVERTTPDRGTTRLTYDMTGLVSTESSPSGERRFAYDAAGRVSSVTVDGRAVMEFGYDDAGRRSHAVDGDGNETRFQWSDTDHLVAIDQVRPDGTVQTTTIDVDGLGRPARINGVAIGFDPVSGRPNRVGDRRIVNAGRLRWDSDTQRWSTAEVGEATVVQVEGVLLMGHRVVDPKTHQFLTPDPLFTVPGTNGASSAYTFCWHDPVNFADPSGLQPISVEDYDAIIERERQGAGGALLQAIHEDPWGYATLALTVVAGGVMTAFPLTSAIGVGILVGVATSTAVQVASGQPFNPTLAAFNGLIGGATMGYGAMGASTATSVATTTATSTGRSLATTMGVNGGIGMVGNAGSQIIQNNGFDNFDISDVFLAGGVTAVTAGVGSQLNPGSAGQAFVQGASVEMAGETVNQVFDSAPGVSVDSILSSGAFGGSAALVEFNSSNPGANFDVGGGAGRPRPVEYTVEAPPTVASINNDGLVTVAGADGTTVRVDHHVTMSDGTHAYVEVRPAGATPGPNGELPLTDNQATVIPQIRETGGFPRGDNATGVYEATGNGPTGPTAVHVVPQGTTIEVGSPILVPR